MCAYPNDIPSVSDIASIIDNTTVLNAASIETGVAAVVKSIMDELGTDPAGSAANLKTRLAVALADSGAINTASAATFLAGVMIHNAQINIELTNKSGGTLLLGDVVVVDITTNNAVSTTTTQDDDKVVGVVSETGPIAANAQVRVCVVGVVTVNVTGAVSRGDLISTSTVVKKAGVASSSVGGNILGKALSGGSSTITAFVMPSGGETGYSGTSGALGTVGTSGASGALGTVGTSGASGASGTSGQVGVSGASGTSGTFGATGASGTSGWSGYSGDASNKLRIMEFGTASGFSAYSATLRPGFSEQVDDFSTGVEITITITKAGTVSAMYVIENNPGTTGQTVYTVRKNKINTSMRTVINAPAFSGRDIVNTFSVVPWDRISILASNTVGPLVSDASHPTVVIEITG